MGDTSCVRALGSQMVLRCPEGRYESRGELVISSQDEYRTDTVVAANAKWAAVYPSRSK